MKTLQIRPLNLSSEDDEKAAFCVQLLGSSHDRQFPWLSISVLVLLIFVWLVHTNQQPYLVWLFVELVNSLVNFPDTFEIRKRQPCGSVELVNSFVSLLAVLIN
jgi:hypothetical protein